MSGQETPGLVLDLTPAPAPAPVPAGGVWGSLREIGGWSGLLRYLPGAVRQVLSGREPVGGLPVVEPGQSRLADLPEIDFGDSFPTVDRTSAEAEATTAAPTVAVEAVAEALAAQGAASSAPAATVVMTGEEADQAHDAWLTPEQADYEAGAGPYAPELTGEDAGPAADGHAAEAATAEAVAELGEAVL